MTAIFILILGLLDILNPLRSLYQKVTSPILFGLRRSALDIKDVSKLFYSLNNIRRENLRLLTENQALKTKLVDLQHNEEENNLLKKQLELKNTSEFNKNLILSSVMGNSTDLTGTSGILDKGTNQGVQEGDAVILGNTLIGVISKVSEERSVARFITSPDVSTTVINLDKTSNAEGIAKGDLGTSIKVSRLLPGDIVEVGDIFTTSGKDGKFQPGFSVGEVKEIQFSSADPLKSVVLKPLVDFALLNKVFILLTK